jgi:hypothetical protein
MRTSRLLLMALVILSALMLQLPAQVGAIKIEERREDGAVGGEILPMNPLVIGWPLLVVAVLAVALFFRRHGLIIKTSILN